MTGAPISDTWALVRAAYCDTTESVAKICARLGVKEKELYRRLDADGWGRRSARPDYVHPFKRAKPAASGELPAPDVTITDTAVANDAAAPTPTKPVRMRGSVPAKPRKRLTAAQKRTKAALALRLYNALDLKLTQLEDLMERGDEKTTIDQGRQTRAISQLIKAFERVTEYDPDLLKSTSLTGLAPGAALPTPAGAAADAASGAFSAALAADPAAAASTEQLRRDIASRIERLVALKKSSENPGGAAPG